MYEDVRYVCIVAGSGFARLSLRLSGNLASLDGYSPRGGLIPACGKGPFARIARRRHGRGLALD